MWKNFLSLLYPSSCLICNRVLHVPENLLCLTCYSDLPKTPLKHSIVDNSTTTDFSGSLALFEYNHSGIKKLIHQLKFEGNYKIGQLLAIDLGKAILSHLECDEIDYIVAVPINSRKRKSRGYNQSLIIAREVSKIIKVPILNALKRKKGKLTQAGKNRYERWRNVENQFKISVKCSLNRKHILLIDDVYTSGATIDACAKVIKKKNDVKISVAVLAIA